MSLLEGWMGRVSVEHLCTSCIEEWQTCMERNKISVDGAFGSLAPLNDKAIHLVH